MEAPKRFDDEFRELDIHGLVENHGVDVNSGFNVRAQSWNRESYLISDSGNKSSNVIALRRCLPEEKGGQKPSMLLAYFSQ